MLRILFNSPLSRVKSFPAVLCLNFFGSRSVWEPVLCSLAPTHLLERKPYLEELVSEDARHLQPSKILCLASDSGFAPSVAKLISSGKLLLCFH